MLSNPYPVLRPAPQRAPFLVPMHRRSFATAPARIDARWLIATLLAMGAVVAAAALFARAVRAETPVSDPQAVKVADRVMTTLGGKQRWDDLEGLRWTFGVAVNDTVRGTPRRHAWDKRTGWHRVEGKNRAGQSYCIIHDIDDGKGMAWVDGQPIEGDSLQKLIKFGKSLWTNDTYWMLMPYKLRDPGVNLKYDGEAKLGDATYDKLALSFENVGETPGDKYWVYVNRATGRVERWEMVLQSDQPPPKAYTWEGWEEKDGLWFPTAHKDDQGRNIQTRDVEAVHQFAAKEFSAP